MTFHRKSISHCQGKINDISILDPWSINIPMEVGDRIRIVKPTTFRKVGDEGVITEIDYTRLHAIIVDFGDGEHSSLFAIVGHCASLLHCNIDVLYEVIS